MKLHYFIFIKQAFDVFIGIETLIENEIIQRAETNKGPHQIPLSILVTRVNFYSRHFHHSVIKQSYANCRAQLSRGLHTASIPLRADKSLAPCFSNGSDEAAKLFSIHKKQAVRF
jgi:hypothetical protein